MAMRTAMDSDKFNSTRGALISDLTGDSVAFHADAMNSKGPEILRSKFRWPPHFPELCPPDDALTAGGVVFRTVTNNPPAPTDFLPLIETNSGPYSTQPNKRHGVSRQFMASGLSACRVYAHAVQLAVSLRERIPAMKNAKVASAELSPELGAIKETPGRHESHITWWIPLGVDPCHSFVVVDELK
ncbi:MAG: hypothetical protein JWN40_3828 [Phycisphaerales bacterium]|nr:hypothetical protein [Phycisphaerales bacterium]